MPPFPDATPTRRASPSNAREILLVVLFLAALFVLSHARALPPGNVLCAADAVLQGSPFSSETSPEGKRGRNEALWDQALQFGPWFRLASRELRAGRFPLWNAHAGCGTVLAANDQSELFFPPMLLALLAGPAWGFFLLALGKHVAAGLGAHLFLRSRGLGIHAGLCAAVAWAFSGPLVVWEGYTVSTVAACLGWALLAVERSAQDGRGVRPSVGLALATAAGLLAGHVQTFFHIAIAVAIYACVRARSLWLERGRGEAFSLLARLALGASLGVLVAAPHVFLFLGELLRSEVLARRRESSVQSAVPLRYLAQLLFLDMEGNPRDGSFYAKARTGNYIELTDGSIGAAGLALVFLAVFAPGRTQFLAPERPRPARLALGAVVLFGLALAFVHAPGLSLLAQVPPLSLARNYRLVVPAAFALAVAAGAGVELVLRRELRLDRSLSAFALAVLAGVATVWIVRHEDAIVQPLSGEPDSLARPFRGFALALSVPLLASATTLTVAWSRMRGALPPRAIGGLLVATVAIEQALVFAWDWNPGVRAERFFPKSPTIEALLAAPEGDRPRTLVLGDIRALPPNVPTAYGLDSVARYDVLGSLAFKPLRDAFGKSPDPDLELFQDFSKRIGRVLGVRYLLVGDPLLDPRRTWESLGSKVDLLLPDADRFAFLGEKFDQGETFFAPGNDLGGVIAYLRVDGTDRATIELQLSRLSDTGLEEILTSRATVGRGTDAAPARAVFSFPPVPGKRHLGIAFRRVDLGTGRVGLFVCKKEREYLQRFSTGKTLVRGALGCYVAGTSPIAPIYTALPVAATVLEDRGALPRARWVGSARVVASVEAALAVLDGGTHDPRKTVVLLGPGASPAGGEVSEWPKDVAPPPEEPGKATIVRYEESEVEIASSAPGPGWVVLADAWHPDWRAEIDGAEVPLLRADAALRAVPVPAGAHTVRFRYAPRLLPLALGLSAATLGVVLVLAFTARRRSG